VPRRPHELLGQIINKSRLSRLDLDQSSVRTCRIVGFALRPSRYGAAMAGTLNEDRPTHCRCLPPGEPGKRFVYYYSRLSDLGLAPEIIDVAETKLITLRCVPLENWLRPDRSKSERLAMGRLLYRRLEELHGHGICHRDMHVGNVVLLAGAPLPIDSALATESDPVRPCYDLYGPGPSGVDVPPDHYDYPPNRGGIWWDCTPSFRHSRTPWANSQRCSETGRDRRPSLFLLLRARLRSARCAR